jgi:hypothetical protein
MKVVIRKELLSTAGFIVEVAALTALTKDFPATSLTNVELSKYVGLEIR